MTRQIDDRDGLESLLAAASPRRAILERGRRFEQARAFVGFKGFEQAEIFSPQLGDRRTPSRDAVGPLFPFALQPGVQIAGISVINIVLGRVGVLDGRLFLDRGLGQQSDSVVFQ